MCIFPDLTFCYQGEILSSPSLSNKGLISWNKGIKSDKSAAHTLLVTSLECTLYSPVPSVYCCGKLLKHSVFYKQAVIRLSDLEHHKKGQ